MLDGAQFSASGLTACAQGVLDARCQRIEPASRIPDDGRFSLALIDGVIIPALRGSG
jgi:hypothetical protein